MVSPRRESSLLGFRFKEMPMGLTQIEIETMHALIRASQSLERIADALETLVSQDSQNESEKGEKNV